jgi:hypothetical protein
MSGRGPALLQAVWAISASATFAAAVFLRAPAMAARRCLAFGA